MSDKATSPSGEYHDNSYVSRASQKQADEPIKVVSDDTPVEGGIDADKADTDAQLERDDTDAIDKSNIIKGGSRPRQPRGTYTEPGDEEGLPGPDDGTSSTR